ncbi:MAG: helix-turn-helix domain-containing protein [Clostridia bacterium]|nr:helix-turn-helix domain-containing protein [Clostridia bacterium]
MPKIATSERITDAPLELNSCGAQILSNRVYSTERKRIDYSLMYVAAGNAVMRVKGKKIALSAGEAMLYPPDTHQDYCYLAGGGVNKWIHFSGSLAAPLGDKNVRKIAIKKRREFESALNKLIDAYNCVSPQKHLLEYGYLTVIIALLIENDSIDSEQHIKSRISEAINYIHLNAFSEVDFNKAAKICYMGRDRFNHVFREMTGYPPNKYLTKIRIDRAKQLLSDDGLTVKEASEIVGYTDLNYFSRVFKKTTGISPKNFGKTTN